MINKVPRRALIAFAVFAVIGLTGCVTPTINAASPPVIAPQPVSLAVHAPAASPNVTGGPALGVKMFQGDPDPTNPNRVRVWVRAQADHPLQEIQILFVPGSPFWLCANAASCDVDLGYANTGAVFTYWAAGKDAGALTETAHQTFTVAGQAAPLGGGSSSTLTADVTPSDLFPDSLPKGDVYVRITNNGPGALANVNVELHCSVIRTGNSGGVKSTLTSAPSFATLNLKPGETASIRSGVEIGDSNEYWYRVTCGIKAPFNDLNLLNNAYTEDIPPQP